MAKSATKKKIEIRPQPGPQTLFASSSADVVIFAGQPGSGKTGALTMELLRGHRTPDYTGAAFRRNANQLVGGGSLFELARKWYPHSGARMVGGGTPAAYWDAHGTSVGYHHLQYESDKEKHDGKAYTTLCFDELPHFTEGQFWYLTSRNRTVSVIKPYTRASSMAAPDSWVHDLVKPYLHVDGWPNTVMSGVPKWFFRNPNTDRLMWFDTELEALEMSALLRLDDPRTKIKPKSFTVVHSLTSDNVKLGNIDDYEATLANLTRVERLRLQGNWEARPPAAGMFDRTWFDVVERVDPSQIGFSVRGWDKAATKKTQDTGAYSDDPDWTRGVLAHYMRDGRMIYGDVCSLQDRPGKVRALMQSTAAQDGPHVTQAYWIDPAQAGKVDEEWIREALAEVKGCGPLVFQPTTKNVEHFARPLSAALDPSRHNTKLRLGAVVRAQWNGPFFAEIEQYPRPKDDQGAKIHDDQVSAMARAHYEWTRQTGSGGSKRWLAGMAAARLG